MTMKSCVDIDIDDTSITESILGAKEMNIEELKKRKEELEKEISALQDDLYSAQKELARENDRNECIAFKAKAKVGHRYLVIGCEDLAYSLYPIHLYEPIQINYDDPAVKRERFHGISGKLRVYRITNDNDTRVLEGEQFYSMIAVEDLDMYNAHAILGAVELDEAQAKRLMDLIINPDNTVEEYPKWVEFVKAAKKG